MMIFEGIGAGGRSRWLSFEKLCRIVEVSKNHEKVTKIPKNHQKDELTNGYLIRRSAVDFNIPLLTNAQLAHHYVEAMCTTDVHSLPAVALQEYTT